MLFEKLDINNIFSTFKDKLVSKLASRDKDILKDLKALEEMFESPNTVDDESHKAILEDLDLFAFSDITVKGRKTNALVESLNRGFEHIINYAFIEGFINVRSILRKANKYELHNESAQLHVSYFGSHQDNFKLFKHIYD